MALECFGIGDVLSGLAGMLAGAAGQTIPAGVLDIITDRGNQVGSGCVDIKEELVPCLDKTTPGPVTTTNTTTAHTTAQAQTGGDPQGGQQGGETKSLEELVAIALEGEMGEDYCCKFGDAESVIQGLESMNISVNANINGVGNVQLTVQGSVSASPVDLRIQKLCPDADCANDKASFKIKVTFTGTFSLKVIAAGQTVVDVSFNSTANIVSPSSYTVTCSGPGN